MSKISIILPTFNVEKYIAKALESCINQTFKDIEIIVVDDCGSDKSIDIAKEYAKKDKRIKIVHNEKNLGLLRARYEGVKAANSLYIMFLDSDDFLELEACEEVSKYLDQNNDLICFNYNALNTTLKKNIFFVNNNYSLKEYLIFLAEQIVNFKIKQWYIWGKVFLRQKYLKTFEKINENPKLTMAEDALLLTLYYLECKRIVTLKQCLINYNMQNISSSTKEIKNFDKMQFFIENLNFVIHKLNLYSNALNPIYFLLCQYFTNELLIHKLQLEYCCTPYSCFFKKIFIKLKRKRIKLKRKKYIKQLAMELK
ncbi:glycosyltransferase [Campylobacter jejuni]|uniref:Glycosyltransferase family 2 protein n=1 Tax=Campylobacter jejuni TaxID=197 RepID=A0AAX1Z645_CAMJU|nr:glycosyltransferase family 2 protein [Campylobacter jejuni]EAH5437575.1 glycosyltransferase family 2 protein [Campylobacter jejuni]EAH8166979.1 glycosyltransferase [Campylobacter jejuni]EAH9241660.1 glycosyltransferase [Campylobacter jejuni]EAI7325112.1 glycosyltransferase [Campylobacter jejuni]EAI9283593.1 glycosyltransferase [Campylobacter jejuni]